MSNPGSSSVDGYNASDFGADAISKSDNDYGGSHYSAYSNSGGQVSWDTRADGSLIDGSEHLSDRNVGGGSWSSWGRDS